MADNVKDSTVTQNSPTDSGPNPLWLQTYANGTVESGNSDGSVTWITDMNGWRGTSCMSAPGADGKRKVETSLIDREGNLVQRWGNDHVLDNIVDNQCIPAAASGAQQNTCAVTNSDYAMLKVPTEPDEYLLIPTTGITGIEDPRLLDPKTPKYFAEALDPKNIALVKDKAVADEVNQLTGKGVAQDTAEKQAEADIAKQVVGVSVNSAAGRSQDRLHLHDDFILPEVQSNLQAQVDAGKISKTAFQDLGTIINGHDYRGLWVDADANGGLGRANPFDLVYNDLPADKKDTMDLQTIVVVPETSADGKKGFVVAAGTAVPATNSGSAGGEEFQHRWVVP